MRQIINFILPFSLYRSKSRLILELSAAVTRRRGGEIEEVEEEVFERMFELRAVHRQI